jgi:hypothetical protein
MYRAYFGTQRDGPVSPIEKDRHQVKAFPDLDEALLWSGEVMSRGTSVTAIEGDDGTHLDKNEIAAYARHAQLRDE